MVSNTLPCNVKFLLIDEIFWTCIIWVRNSVNPVLGILQADFVEPTHNKQDFEKTSLFQKLEARLKEMTWEYWYSVFASVSLSLLVLLFPPSLTYAVLLEPASNFFCIILK